jgi:hypothetical protein
MEAIQLLNSLEPEPTQRRVFEEIIMAHFARLGVGNVVEEVVAVSNDVATTEQAGIDFLHKIYGDSSTWVQASYNKSIRKNFASKGSEYKPTDNAFVPEKRHKGWKLNKTTMGWEPPIPKPSDGSLYRWNDSALAWQGIV